MEYSLDPRGDPSDPDATNCPGCGGHNLPGTAVCDWCGRPFGPLDGAPHISLRAILSALAVVVLAAVVVALALLNATRSVTVPAAPVQVILPTSTVASPVPGPSPTPTPTTIPQLPSQTQSSTIMPAPPTPTDTPPSAQVGNTGGQGAVLRDAPGSSGRALLQGLRDGTTLVPTGQVQTVEGQQWVEVLVPDLDLQGWLRADFVQTSA